MMRLTILGHCGSFPGEGKACSGYIVETENECVLMECGNGVLSRFQRFHRLEDISAIVLSHLHFDHIGDLFILKYALETKLALGDGSFLPIPVYLPENPQSVVQNLMDNRLFEFHFISNEKQYQIGSLDLRFRKMTHTIESYAISIQNDLHRIVYSGDTTTNDELELFANQADLFLCESTISGLNKNTKILPHLNAEEAGKIATKAGVKELLLTHFGLGEDTHLIHAEAMKQFSKVKLANEFETYMI
jgi:ribonuclease BN (tRNA processing enzyme)